MKTAPGLRCVLTLPLAVFGFAAVSSSQAALAQDFEFAMVADTDTAIPGGSGTFLGFGSPSIDREGNIVFCGLSYSRPGLYTTVGGSLRVVADESTPIPGQATTFAHGFRTSGASIDEGMIAFYAFTASTELGGGVYLWQVGPSEEPSISTIADGNTPVPGGTETFNSIEDPLGFGPFSDPPNDGEDVAFRGSADRPRQRGVYTRLGGSLEVVADLETPVPGWTGNFTFLSAEISIEDGKVAFRGEGQGPIRGIYTNFSGDLEKVVDTQDPIPGGTGVFTSVVYPWLDAGRILFCGEGADGQEGIYLWKAGYIDVIADRNTPIPGGTGTFADFAFNWSQPSLRGETIVFRALDSDGREGIYLHTGGSLLKVIDDSDTLDGKAIAGFSTGPQSSSGERIALGVQFVDGSSGIYIAEDPPIVLPSERFLRGDANSDGIVDVSDPITILCFLFAGGCGELSCQKSADTDDSGNLNVTDAVGLLGFLFTAGPTPREPFEDCGTDPVSDDLACERYEPCR